MENFGHGTGLSPSGEKESHEITEGFEKDITNDYQLGEKQNPQLKGVIADSLPVENVQEVLLQPNTGKDKARERVHLRKKKILKNCKRLSRSRQVR